MRIVFKSSYALIALIFSLIMKGQVTFEGVFNKAPDKFKADSLDSGTTVFYYTLSFVKDSKRPDLKVKTLTRLTQGNHYSKFEDLNTYKRDSILRINSIKENVGTDYLNALVKFRPQWNNVVIKSFQNGTMTLQDKAFKYFQYQEPIPTINWRILPSVKKILSVDAQLAVGTYRGRKYNAWFTRDIAINNGPYVFGNLPGLIVEIYDDENQFHFELVGIKKETIPIMIRTDDKIIKTDRSKFRVAQRSYYENPGAALPEAYDTNGEVIQQKFKSKPYNPIELE